MKQWKIMNLIKLKRYMMKIILFSTHSIQNFTKKYFISYDDYIKYVRLTKRLAPRSFQYTFHGYYTGKNINGEYTICSVDVIDPNNIDYELNRFETDDNYRIDFVHCSITSFITFTDLETGIKVSLGEQ